eukprot:2296428-Amphidinium_carterae.1
MSGCACTAGEGACQGIAGQEGSACCDSVTRVISHVGMSWECRESPLPRRAALKRLTSTNANLWTSCTCRAMSHDFMLR